MRKQTTVEKVAPVKHQAAIDLVVPFTTPELTKAALEAASRMGAGLNAAIRLVRVQVIPSQLDICQSPVGIHFLKEQLAAVKPEITARREVRFARDWKTGLMATLTLDSLVVLAARKRFWRTHNERLADALRRDGYRVVLVMAGQDLKTTVMNEVAHA